MRPNIKTPCKIIGDLYDSTENGKDMSTNMLEIQFPNKTFISVGWYPFEDPEGNFIIDDHVKQKSFDRKTAKEVIKYIEENY